MPSKVRRWSFHGRPGRPATPGSTGSRRAHNSSEITPARTISPEWSIKALWVSRHALAARALTGSTYALLGLDALLSPGARVGMAKQTLAAMRRVLLLPVDDEMLVRDNAAVQLVVCLQNNRWLPR